MTMIELNNSRGCLSVVPSDCEDRYECLSTRIHPHTHTQTSCNLFRKCCCRSFYQCIPLFGANISTFDLRNGDLLSAQHLLHEMIELVIFNTDIDGYYADVYFEQKHLVLYFSEKIPSFKV